VEGLREAELRYVQDVARSGVGDSRQNVWNLRNESVRCCRDSDCHGFDRLGAASASYASGRARRIVTAGAFSSRARLVNDEACEPRRTDGQGRDNDCEDEPRHAMILAFARAQARLGVVRGPRRAPARRAVQSLWRDSTIFLGGRAQRCEGTEIEAIFVALSVRCGK
jgi:hypothetical protein